MENEKHELERREKERKELDRREAARVEERGNNTPWFGIIMLQILIIAILGAILLPYKIVATTEQVQYSAIEEYYGTEPYLTTTSVKVKIPVNYSKCDYETPYYFIDTSSAKEGNSTSVLCSILNLASLPTDFIYYIYSMNDKGKEIDRTSERRVTVNPHDVFETTELIPVASAYGCHVQPQLQVDCVNMVNFTETTKDQLSVKSKQVMKLKLTTKYRTDTNFRSVNWLFNNQMPWQNSWKEIGNMTYYIAVKT